MLAASATWATLPASAIVVVEVDITSSSIDRMVEPLK
jgi:hypothetical protein